MEAVAKPGVVSPAIAVLTSRNAKPNGELLQLAEQLRKLTHLAAAVRLYEAGFRPISNALRIVSRPSAKGLETAQLTFGKEFSADRVYAHTCKCDSRAQKLKVSTAAYKALKDLVLRFGAAPAVKKSVNGRGVA